MKRVSYLLDNLPAQSDLPADRYLVFISMHSCSFFDLRNCYFSALFVKNNTISGHYLKKKLKIVIDILIIGSHCSSRNDLENDSIEIISRPCQRQHVVRTGGGCPKPSRVPSTRKALCVANLSHRKCLRHFGTMKTRFPEPKFSCRLLKAHHIMKNRKVTTLARGVNFR